MRRLSRTCENVLNNRRKIRNRPACVVGGEHLETRDLMTSVIFEDSLVDNWQNYSWDTSVDWNHDQVVRDGDAAIQVKYDNSWAGLYLALPNGERLAAGTDDTLTFSIHGGSAEKQISVVVVNQDDDWIQAELIQPASNRWSEVSIPMSSVGQPQAIRGLVFQEFGGDTQEPFYLDNIVLEGDGVADSPGPVVNPPLETESDVAALVYEDSLDTAWQNWSWLTASNVEYVGQSQSGTSSISVKHEQPWAGFYLAAPEAIPSAGFDTVTFSVHGGAGGQTIDFAVVDGDGESLPGTRITPDANRWNSYSVDLNLLGSPAEISGLVWQEFSGSGNQNTFFLDDIYFTSTSEVGGETPQLGDGPTITIDPSTTLGEISDDIYGLNFADESLASELGLSVDRWGGNSTTRYNYRIDASNRGSDFFFENHPEERQDATDPLLGSSSLNDFVRKDQRVGADSVVTVNTIGWMSKSREIIGGFEVDKYGPQQEENPYRNNGNGIRPDGTPITGNDPADTSIVVGAEYAGELVDHLVSLYGAADEGGVQYYALDNEPMLWNSTHRDVHPEPASYGEVFEKGLATAAAIKAADPTAEVLGPTVWGWVAYFYSALDVASSSAFWLDPQDRNAHEGQPFLPWYLEQMADAEQEMGQRYLDYLDIHYYPQQDGVALTRGGGSLATQASRLESTRSLWDPTYKDDSWIDEEVQLIPRMRDWIDEYYPGTKLAITEYNFGGTNHISGAVAQADVLGIFGREGVDLATMWGSPAPDEPAAYAFRMYRNYDGEANDGSRFGETLVAASSSDQNAVSVFAAERGTDDALTVMLVNKTTDDLVSPVSLSVEHDGSVVEVYTYDASDLSQIVVSERDLSLSNGGHFDVELPGMSITLLEIGASEFVEPDYQVESSERVGRPNELSAYRLTFDAAITLDELDLELTRNGQAVDVSLVQPTWDPMERTATWNFTSLGLEPGRYTAKLSLPTGQFEEDMLVTFAGDTNLNGVVGFDDVPAFAEGLSTPDPKWEDGDFDGDGELTFWDFLEMANNFGKNVDDVLADF